MGFLITLVASNLPPRPVSIINMSDFSLLKAKKAAAVVISKKVIDSPLLTISHSCNSSPSNLFEINFDLILILSLNFIKCGDVYTFTLYPELSKIDLRNDVTEPFPLVPAIWITGDKSKCGLPNLKSNFLSLDRDKSIFFGCRFSSLSNMFLNVVTIAIHKGRQEYY